MHAIPTRSSQPDPTVGSGPFAWEVVHAAPEDRAVGLELELIEMVARRRSMGTSDGPEVAALDAEIDRTLDELATIASAPLVS